MGNYIQPELKRDTVVHILVSDEPPYKITNKKGDLIGLTLQDGMGVYLHNVNFKVVDGRPLLVGRFKGLLEENRMNISEGVGVMFDPAKEVFSDGAREIKTARMVQVYNGIIKVVIK
ncbi:hypothetical protein MOD67_13815 [Bacillus licheniformis]|uniref:hypothetical protein n=1 Tax=Bacillus TaxID=1386 RepID=UPI0022822645|nr:MULTISPECIES: hypothetical protein [Bacillus]MCY7861098.1 hypothetical protein [Bacillus haynesii]MCY8015573.1 hypothetical protein [Bacillus haynesii]MCY8291572.1 hypothetical protein [Bacillus haynesii]MCY8549196.1 hypothetical protein [Bacillus haynesii]MCY8745057.1 hypothetical protein [Bacillus licheniformis]